MNLVPKLTPTTNDQLTGAHAQMPPELVYPVLKTISPADEIQPKAEPAAKKIAIVGTAPSSRGLAPYGDLSWKIWACSPGNMNIVPRVDAWFEIHNSLLWPENKSYGPAYIEWLKQQKFPIYMQNQSMVPNALTYPKDEMVEKFGKFFFTSSFAWMMALAISQMRPDGKRIDGDGAELALFGVDMASKDEYILQRPGGHYFMQVATSLGIKVSLPMESDLAQPPALYGYVDSTPLGRKMVARKLELTQRVAELTQLRDQHAQNIIFLNGALEDLNYFEAIWSGVQT